MTLRGGKFSIGNANFRAVLIQLLLVGCIAVALHALVVQSMRRLDELGIRSGFAFLAQKANFDIGEQALLPILDRRLIVFLVSVAISLIAAIVIHSRLAKRTRKDGQGMTSALATILFLGAPLAVLYFEGGIDLSSFSSDDTLGKAFLVGITNTLRISVLTIASSTLLGLLVALMRLSRNVLLKLVARMYVEFTRNIPLLVHMFFWYFGILRNLPPIRHSISFGKIVWLNNRGLFLPEPLATPGTWPFCIAIFLSIAVYWLLRVRARRSQTKLGVRPSTILPGLLMAATFILGSWLIFGEPFALAVPVRSVFNIRNAAILSPEFAALALAMTFYQGAYAAEIIRGGIQSVAVGQKDAAQALGLNRFSTFRLVTLPIALRSLIPPMLARYSSLVKSTSLAVAIGYPEVVSIAKSIEYVTGQAIEPMILAIAFYLFINIVMSFFLNLYNRRIQEGYGNG